MKLRNKKTGEIVEFDNIGFRTGLSDGFEDFIPKAISLAELIDNWEDYKPKKPLIKDEKVRKAVRAWADACEINSKDRIEVTYEGFNFGSFIMYIGDGLIEKSGFYTIAELCGEESNDN